MRRYGRLPRGGATLVANERCSLRGEEREGVVKRSISWAARSAPCSSATALPMLAA